MNVGQEGVGGETNLEFLLLASQVRLGRDAHSNDGKTSLKWLKCRKELGSNELNTASAGFETNLAERSAFSESLGWTQILSPIGAKLIFHGFLILPQ